MSNSRFYWLKLKRDFFKRSDIKIIENMPNGKDYVLFYLKLLLESIEHNGSLRFSDTIPYDEAMLSTITDTNIDIVRAAMKVLTSTGLIEVMADDTIFMSEVQSMIGVASQDEHTRESTRLRVQAYRERKKQTLIEEGCYSNVTCNGEIELDIDKELDKEKDISPKVDISLKKETKAKKENFDPVAYLYTIEDIKDDPQLIEAFKDFFEMRKVLKKPLKTSKGVNGRVNECKRLAKNNHELMIKILNQSVEHEWLNLYELKESVKPTYTPNNNGLPFDEWTDDGGIFT